MANFLCDGCGQLMHLGACEAQTHMTPVLYHRIDRKPDGEVIVRLNGVVVASGFDSREEAQSWIDEQPKESS